MSRAGRKTRRKRTSVVSVRPTASIADIFRAQLAMSAAGTPLDTRTHAEFLADMRAKQSAGLLANPGNLAKPATAALLDRLEAAIHGARYCI